MFISQHAVYVAIFKGHHQAKYDKFFQAENKDLNAYVFQRYISNISILLFKI